jgi:Protein of unknown function (DUF3575)
MTGAVAQNVRAAEDTGSAAAPLAEPPTADDGTAPSPEPTGEAPRRPAKRRQAQSAPQSPAPSEPWSFGRPAEINHYGQFGLSIMPGSGYRVIAPYADGVPCGDSSGNRNQRVCAHILPFFLDIEPSFGLHRRLDLIVDLRFALQKDPATFNSHQFALAPGVRYWLDQDVALKFYATGQFIYDYTNYGGVVRNSDWGLRNADGLMYDAIKNVGFFVQVGWTMEFLRWFRMEFDAGLGVQLRFP